MDLVYKSGKKAPCLIIALLSSQFNGSGHGTHMDGLISGYVMALLSGEKQLLQGGEEHRGVEGGDALKAGYIAFPSNRLHAALQHNDDPGFVKGAHCGIMTGYEEHSNSKSIVRDAYKERLCVCRQDRHNV